VNDKPIRPATAGRILAEQRVKVLKRCKHCGELFDGIRTRIYCSDKCRNDAGNEKKRKEPGSPKRKYTIR